MGRHRRRGRNVGHVRDNAVTNRGQRRGGVRRVVVAHVRQFALATGQSCTAVGLGARVHRLERERVQRHRRAFAHSVAVAVTLAAVGAEATIEIPGDARERDRRLEGVQVDFRPFRHFNAAQVHAERVQVLAVRGGSARDVHRGRREAGSLGRQEVTRAELHFVRRGAEHGEHFSNGLHVISQLVASWAPARANRHAEARIGARLGAGVETRIGANDEVHVVANAEDVAAGSTEVRRAKQTRCRAGARSGHSIATSRGGQRLFNARVVLRLVVQRVRQDVRHQRRETNEQRTDAEVLETRGFDEHFFRHQVVRLRQRRGGRQGNHQGGRVVRDELHPAHFFEVTFHLEVVAEHDRREATRVRYHRVGSAVRGRAQRVTGTVSSGGSAATGYGWRGVRIATTDNVLRRQTRPGAGSRARNADGEAGAGSVGVVVRVQREARVRAAVVSARLATKATLNGVALRGVVHAHHHARGSVVHHAVQAHVAFGVVDVTDAARDHLLALGDENVTGNQVASRGLVGRNGGNTTEARVVAGVALGETRFTGADASGRRLFVQLPQSQPVRWEVQQKVAWQDDALASHRDDTARPMVGWIIQMDVLDFTLDRCPGRHGICRTECQAACQCQKHRDRLCGWGCTCEQLCGLHV